MHRNWKIGINLNLWGSSAEERRSPEPEGESSNLSGMANTERAGEWSPNGPENRGVRKDGGSIPQHSANLAPPSCFRYKRRNVSVQLAFPVAMVPGLIKALIKQKELFETITGHKIHEPEVPK